MNIEVRRKTAAAAAAVLLLSGAAGISGTQTIGASAAGTEITVSANGSDKADDTAAIQNALKTARSATAASPVTVYLPSGTYYINKPLRIYSHTIFKLAPDAVIVRSSDAQYMLSYEGVDGSSSGYNKLTDVTVEGGVWDGNVTNTLNAKGLVLIRNANNITFKDTAFRNVCGTHYILFDGVSDITVTGCKFSDFKAFSGTASQYAKATNNSDPNCFKYRTAEVIHTDYINNTPCKNVSITNCTFEGTPTAAGTHHVQSSISLKGFSFKNNTLKNCYFYAVNAASFSDLEVSGNTLTNCGGLIYAEDTKGIVSNNTLTARDASGSIYKNDVTPINCVHAMTGSSITLNNNTLKNCSGFGVFADNAKVTGSGNTITAKRDVTYSRNGGTISLSGKSSSNSSKTKISASDFKISSSFSYKGRQIKPAVTSSLKKNTDFTVKYGTNTKVGQGTVTITGKGSYTGTVKLTFKIIPAKQTVTVTKTSTGAKFKWKKDTAATKYYYRYSTTSSFKKYTTKSVGKNVTSKTFKIAAGKTYYVKVRTISVINGVTYSGSWSNPVKLTRK